MSLSTRPNLPAYPERPTPVPTVAGREFGVDLKRDCIGMYVEVEPYADAGELRSASLLHHGPAGEVGYRLEPPLLFREQKGFERPDLDLAVTLRREHGCAYPHQ